MNVKNYLKNQLENISDALILEAADTDLDYKSEGQIYYIKESFMDKIRKITTAAACFLLLISAVISFILIRESITNKNDDPLENDPSYKAALKTAETLFTLDLTSEEKAFIEDILDKDFDTITQDDIDSCNTICIVGNHAFLEFNYYPAKLNKSYKIDDVYYDIGLDYSEHLHLLKYFTKIKDFSLYYQNNLKDVSFLKYMPDLEKLWINGTRIEDLTVLNNHKSLKILNVEQSPLSKLEFHNEADLEIVMLQGTYFGDLSVFKGQTEMVGITFRNCFVPIINTEVLTHFTELNSLQLVAPVCDYSFFKNIQIPIPNICIGGNDNIDLSQLERVLPTVGFFELQDSNGVDLTLLDDTKLNSTIYLSGSEPGNRGKRTAEENENFRIIPSITADIIEYYKLYLPEFLPDEFK